MGQFESTHLDRWYYYRGLLGLPRFSTIEELEAAAEERSLLVRAPGFYTVYVSYIARDREGNERIAFREEMSFLQCDVYRARCLAEQEIGAEELERRYG